MTAVALTMPCLEYTGLGYGLVGFAILKKGISGIDTHSIITDGTEPSETE